MQNRAELKKVIASQIDAAIDYLDNHIIYNHDEIDITADFFTRLEKMETHLESAVKDETGFQYCRSYILEFNLYLITSIEYANDQINFLKSMRSLMDNLNRFSESKEIKSTPREKFFSRHDSAKHTKSDEKPSNSSANSPSPK